MLGLQEMTISVAIDDANEDWIEPVLRLLRHVPCSIRQLRIQVDLTAWPDGCSFPSKVICDPWCRVAGVLRARELESLQRIHVRLYLGRRSREENEKWEEPATRGLAQSSVEIVADTRVVGDGSGL